MALKRERCFTDEEFSMLALVEQDIDRALQEDWKGDLFQYKLPVSAEPGKVFNRQLSEKEKKELVKRYKDAGWTNAYLEKNMLCMY